VTNKHALAKAELPVTYSNESGWYSYSLNRPYGCVYLL